MKRWIFTARVEPPAEVISARSGGSVFFAAYSKWLDQWYLIANGSQEILKYEPEMLFLEESYGRDHPRDLIKHPVTLRPGKEEQLQLF